MPAIRLVVDKKYVQRHLEGFGVNADGTEEVLAIRGDALLEHMCEEVVPSTAAQCDTLTKLVQGSGDGIVLVLAEDGSLSLIV